MIPTLTTDLIRHSATPKATMTFFFLAGEKVTSLVFEGILNFFFQLIAPHMQSHRSNISAPPCPHPFPLPYQSVQTDKLLVVKTLHKNASGVPEERVQKLEIQ